MIGFLLTTAGFWLLRGAIASALGERGLKAKNEWQLQTAVSYFDWSLFFSDDFDARFEKGVCLQLRGNFRASQKVFDVLLKTQIEDKAKLSRLHNAIGVNFYSFAKPADSAASHQKALELAQNARDRRLEAESLIGLSRVFYHSQGKVDAALANLEQAKAIAREISDERIEAAALRNIGTIYWWFKAELDRPLREFYFPALELYRRQNDRRGAATMLTLIALVFNSKGDVYRFMQYQNESIDIQEQIGDEAGLSDSYMTMGQLYDGIGNYRKAREFYAKGLEITERTGYFLARSDFEALLAQVHLNLEEFDEAIRLYDPLSEHKSEDSGLFNVTGVAYSYQLKGDYAQALILFQRALRAYQDTGTPDFRFEANNLLRSAECAFSLGDWEHARRFMRQADEIFQKLETHSEGELQLALVRAKLARRENRHQPALKYLEDALEIETRIFASASTNFLIPPHRRIYENLYNFLLDYSISNPDEKTSQKANELLFAFLENMRYRSLRNFLIQVTKSRSDAPPKDEKELDLVEQIKRLSQKLKQGGDQAVREQLRKTYDKYEEITLRAQLAQPQYLAIRQAKPAGFAQIQQKLSAGTALIEFLFAGERVFALIATQNGLRTIALPVSKSNLAAKTKLHRSLIFTSDEKETDWLPIAESLRAVLIEPMEKSGALRGIKRVGLIPYGFLHDLPFAALARRENENVKFLVEDYILFQTPSATLYANKSGEEISRSQTGATIAFGRHDFTKENLPALPFAEEETKAIAQITGGIALTNNQATETEIKRLSGSADHLHFSTHAVAESEMPLLSRLLLEPTNTDDGQLTVREIFELGLRAKLVTLSACETAQSFSASGNDFVEQDRIGLIEAFLHAGSKSVLASQFPVSDKPTSEFMKDFYTNLLENDKAQSLALTQRKMIQGQISIPEKNFKHPRNWSSFMLTGSDR